MINDDHITKSNTMTPAQAHNVLVNGAQGRDTRVTAEEKAKATAISAKIDAEKRHDEKVKAGMAESEKQRKAKRLADLQAGWDGYRKVTKEEAQTIIAAEKLT